MTAAVKSKLTLLLLFVYGVMFAQDRSRKQDPVPIRLAVPQLAAPFPFKSIEVADLRYDTSKIGYVQKKKENVKLVTSGSLASHLEQQLNNATTEKTATASEQSVLVVIKKFWLKRPTETDWRRKHGVDGRGLKSLWGWHVKLEVYGNYSGAYTPLFRLDSLYGFDEFDEQQPISVDAFSDCLQRLQNIDPAKLKTAKTKYTRQAVDSFNQAAFLKPVLTQPAMPVGVFLTFSDFINKRVTYSEFAIERAIELDNLYIFKNNSKELLTDFWGFSDGKKYFIRANRNFFELYQQGNTFEFIGHEYLALNNGSRNGHPAGSFNSGRSFATGLATGLLTDAIAGGSKTQEWFRPFQLNIETGEIY